MAGSKKTAGALPWGLKEDKLKPNSVEELSKEKLKAFSIGTSKLKRSVYQKKREEKLVKKEMEAKETAKVFEDFVATFDECDKATKTFVRGSVINPEEEDKVVEGSIYQPAPSKQLKNTLDKKPEKESITSTQKLSKKKVKSTEKKKSILEMFGEELKRMQDERTDQHTGRKSGEPLLQPPSNVDREQFKVEDYPDLPKGSIDCVDPLTTNLYVGNINPKMTEEMLCQHFGKFGPLASIKIMWPRTEEEKLRNKNCGFVAFMKRDAAERALEAMKGSSIMSYEVQVGWGKTVPLPPKPFYVAPISEAEETKFVSDPHSGGTHSSGHYSNVPPPDSKEGFDGHTFDEVLYNSVIRVVAPSDNDIVCLIHRMIEFVIREGPMFEAMIMNKEMGNPKFKFLFDNTSTDHIYYRWKLFSILQGDSPETWHVDEFRMFEGGSLWKPPTLKNLRGKVIPPIMEIVKKGQLAAKFRDALENTLRNITMERSKVMEAMIWCIDHADSAEEVSECLYESLSLQETPLPMKIARLYLVNDILQNSTAKNASMYRRIFEGKLISMMEHLHVILCAIESRLRAESFKRRVLKCLQAWDQLSVYHFNFVDKLREIFIGKTQEELEKKKAFQTVAALMAVTEHQPDPPVIEEAPLVDDRPIDFSGGFSVPVDEDLDGEPLLDPDVDGIPMEEDLDGIPMDTAVSHHAIQSKWEMVEYGHESSDDEDKSSKIKQRDKSRFDVEIVQSTEEQKRQLLRDVELKVLELIEALDSSGSYTSAEVNERATKFRQKLLHEADSMECSSTSALSEQGTLMTNEVFPLESQKHSSNSEKSYRSHSPGKRKKHTSPTRKRSPEHSSTRRSRSRSPYGHHSKSPHSHRHGKSSSPRSRKEQHRSRSPTSHKSKKPRH